LPTTITDLTCKRHYHRWIDVQFAAAAPVAVADADADADADVDAYGHGGSNKRSSNTAAAAKLIASLDDCKPSFPFIFTF